MSLAVTVFVGVTVTVVTVEVMVLMEVLVFVTVLIDFAKTVVVLLFVRSDCKRDWSSGSIPWLSRRNGLVEGSLAVLRSIAIRLDGFQTLV